MPVEAPATRLVDRLRGAVWGHLVGDALGAPYEFQLASQIGEVEFRGGGTHGQPAGTWSDDGALMLALLDSLLSVGFDTQDQGRRALAWADGGAYTPDGDGPFDIGNTTSDSLARIRRGVPAEEAGGTGERDNGNGSLMRILPVALVERELSVDTLVDHAQRASSVTHGHPISQAACALYCLIVRGVLQGEADRREILEASLGALSRRYDVMGDADRRAALRVIESWPGRSGRGYVVDSFWSAWEAFAEADSYRSAVVRAVKYGGDTDTTACISGGLAGAYWGVAGIPAEWLAGMRGTDIVEPLLQTLGAQSSLDSVDDR